MTISDSTLAGAVGLKFYNKQFVPTSEILEQVIAVVGTYNPAKTEVVDEVPIPIYNEADAGNRFDFGWPLHRLIKAVFEENGGCAVYAIPQTEVGTAATGSITFSGTATAAGTIYIREAGVLIASVPVAVNDAAAAIGPLVDAAMDLYRDAMTTPTAAGAAVTVDSKAKTTWGNGISITVNEFEDMPAGITAVVVDLASGATLPDIDDALAGLGSGDEKNSIGITKMVTSYGYDADTISKISVYNGLGNIAQGLYEDVITKPFVCFHADVTADGLTAIRAIGDANKSDRTNIILGAPTSNSHPDILAAWACGACANINIVRAEQDYRGIPLSRAHVGTTDSDRWTGTHANRELAVQSGIGTTRYKNGVLVLEDVCTMYHPDDISDGSNGFRRARDLSITQNLMNSLRSEFEGQSWQGITLVSDKSNVTNTASRAKVRDLSDVRSALIALVKSWGSRAWLFDPQHTIDAIAAGTVVSLRPGGNGINFNMPLIYSATFDIVDGTVEFDIALTIFLQ